MTKTLMTASAVFMAVAGLGATFAPDELGAFLGIHGAALLIQLAGALYIGFAIANWTAKDSLIGGIYNRALAIGNTVHFVVGAFALLRAARDTRTAPLVIAAAMYAMFALGFGRILFGPGSTVAPAEARR